MIETTLALIKPDAVQNRHAGMILHQMENHFAVCDVNCAIWSRSLVAQFYLEHKDRPFFGDLIEFMTMDRIYAVTLVGPNAVGRWRALMGATDPKKADADTIRGIYGSKIGPIMHNAVHGSDSQKRAFEEIDIVRKATRVSKSVRYTTMSAFGDVAQQVSRYMIAAAPEDQGAPVLLDEDVRAAIENGEDEPEPEPVKPEDFGAHAAHCCKEHGCKYASLDCPVESGEVQRQFNAGWCQEPGLVEDPEKCRVEGETMPGPGYHE